MNHLVINDKKSDEIRALTQKHGFDKQLSHLAIGIIDLKENTPSIFGINLDSFIYPASVYKVFVGAEVLRQVEAGIHSLEAIIVVNSPNDVDKDPNLFPGDQRSLLKAGESYSVDYLLDLMLSRSDNTATNCLIDLVDRKSINENIIKAYGWAGSEVTRKFLDRKKEDEKYRYVESTATCVRHVAEFFYLVETKKLLSPFVSEKLKEYMLKWKPYCKDNFDIREKILRYRKGGYLETNLYKSIYKKSGFGFDFSTRNFLSLIKNIFTKGWAFSRYMHDAGVVEGKNSHYVIVVFTLSKQLNPRKYFQMDELAKVIYEYMEKNKKA